MMIIQTIELIVLIYFSLAVLYNAFFAVLGHKRGSVESIKDDIELSKIAILVPAYKEDAIIESTVRNILNQNYPSDRYEIVVIADSFKQETIQSLYKLPITLFPVEFEKSTKAKSLNYALDRLKDRNFDLAVILDADNWLEAEYLQKVNQFFQMNNCKALQTRRVAKNLDTSYAVLDAASEIINNHLYRKGYYNSGMSSALIGSGMVFDFDLIHEKLKHNAAVGGFDKDLQLSLVSEGIRIHFLNSALVYDEKVSNEASYQNQRKRWYSSQYIYFIRNFNKGIVRLLQGNVDFFNLAVVHNLFPSRVLLLGVLTLLLTCSLILDYWYPTMVLQWSILFTIYILTLGICLPGYFYRGYFLKALFSVPGIILNAFLIQFRLKGANNKFIHTTHSIVEVKNEMVGSK